jgi:hypothetical protein
MLSATVRNGNSASAWNTIAKLRWWAGVAVISMPFNNSVPAVGVSNPAIMRSKVVLPQPDGPRKQTNCPAGTCNDTLSTAT